VVGAVEVEPMASRLNVAPGQRQLRPIMEKGAQAYGPALHPYGLTEPAQTPARADEITSPVARVLAEHCDRGTGRYRRSLLTDDGWLRPNPETLR
jgi:hypothetical protein